MVNWTIKITTVFCLITFAFLSEASASKESEQNLWKKVNKEQGNLAAKSTKLPEKYLVFELNQRLFSEMKTEAPTEFTDDAVKNPLIMEIPMPDGSIQRFRMEETAVLSPVLAARFPEWKTFVGYGVDNPKLIGRFDWNVFGFHGFVATENGTVYIDPLQKGETNNYLVYYKQDYGKSDNIFYCGAKDVASKLYNFNENYQLEPSAPTFAFGATVRTYRLAVGTTGEWSRNAANYTPGQTPAQTRAGALGVLQTSVNRLSGIYERELASRFMIVNPDPTIEAANILFDDPATDPYNNTDQADDLNGNVDQLRVNQQTLDARVTTANYDIGHLYGTGGGGVAASPSLCRNGTMGYPNAKAQGYSARGTNTGDPFTVDYVAHEIGHQFGAGHTYNNSDPAMTTCDTRSIVNAYEVASGSTIMSYVGICVNRNLQQFVDTGFSSFHIRSLTQINTNITTDAPNDIPGCGVAAGANNVPTINAGASFTIPTLTPFALTATGGDADAADVPNLLYSWEQYDLAPSASGVVGAPAGTYDVDTDGILRPLFRAYSPIASNSRSFPSLTFILNPATNDPAGSNQPTLTYMGVHPTGFPGAVCEPAVECVVGERLPTVARAMNFRVSVRDRRGGMADAGTTVTVAAGTGPFKVTAQDTLLAPNWAANSTQTVTWDVAGTAAAPISSANVNILLSTNGGLTFPTTLLANTPNDGTEQITVPNAPTTMARLKVEAVGNVFFDISNVNFTILAPTAANVSVAGRVLSNTGHGIPRAIVQITDQKGNVRAARTNSFGYYRFEDLQSGESFVFNTFSKGYEFSSRVITVNDNISGLDFIAN